jgi:hypothetical protein
MKIIPFVGSTVNKTISQSETTCAPSVEAFLKINPLPPHLAHVESAVRSLPSVRTLIETIMNCAIAGLDDSAIAAALTTASAYHNAKSHRCASCLGWTKEALAMALVNDGAFSILAICPRCERMIDQGRATKAMRANLAEYGGLK